MASLAARLAFVFAASLTPLAPGAAAVAAEPAGRPLPGYWEGRSHWSIVVAAKTDIKRQCLSAAQVERWMTSPAPKHYTCTYDDREVGDGHMSLRGACLDKKGQGGDVAASGTFTPDAFHIDARLTRLRIGGLTLPLKGAAQIDARRISAACPAGMVAGK